MCPVDEAIVHGKAVNSLLLASDIARHHRVGVDIRHLHLTGGRPRIRPKRARFRSNAMKRGLFGVRT